MSSETNNLEFPARLHSFLSPPLSEPAAGSTPAVSLLICFHVFSFIFHFTADKSCGVCSAVAFTVAVFICVDFCSH